MDPIAACCEAHIRFDEYIGIQPLKTLFIADCITSVMNGRMQSKRCKKKRKSFFSLFISVPLFLLSKYSDYSLAYVIDRSKQGSREPVSRDPEYMGRVEE